MNLATTWASPIAAISIADAATLELGASVTGQLISLIGLCLDPCLSVIQACTSFDSGHVDEM